MVVGPDGRRVVDEFTEDYYRAFMKGWEAALNAHLARIDGDVESI